MKNENRREFLGHAGAAWAGLATRWHSGNSSFDAAQQRAIPGGPTNPESRQPIRGMMVDAARLPEPLDHYRRAIEFCAEWRLNTLQFRMTDDQGTALRFATVPDLITHPNALTPDQAKTLVEFAGAHGVDIIPEVESFGHTGFITRSPKYAHLLDNDPQGSGEFTGVIPVLPETREVFEKLYREVAAIFPSVYLHAGCDEVNWGGSPQSRKALESRTRPQIWAEYLNALDDTSKSLGKQLIVWGDFVLHKEPEILSTLHKSIIIMDWNYWDTSAIEFRAALVKAGDQGFRGIGGPGLISYRWGPRPGREQLRNIDAFAEAYANHPASLGVILTNWVPTRYVQNSLWDGFAYGAVAFQDGPAAARTSAFRRFVERHYQAEWNEAWAEAFELLYDATPGYSERASISPMGLRLKAPWSSDAELVQALKDRTAGAGAFTRVLSLLAGVQPAVRRNLADFEALLLSVECLENSFWRDAQVREHAAPKAQSANRIQAIAQRDRELAAKLLKDWDKSRDPGSAAGRELIFDLQPKDQLLYQWRKAAAYSSSLAQNPEDFQRLVAERTQPVSAPAAPPPVGSESRLFRTPQGTPGSGRD